MESITIDRPLGFESLTSPSRNFGVNSGQRNGKVDFAKKPNKDSFLPLLRKGNRMYAIAFDLDTEILEKGYKNASYNNAYGDIRKHLEQFGFDWRQGSVYFGTEKVNAVTCVLAVQSLTKTFPWYAPAVKDIRMLRIEENNDLRPAIDDAKN